MTISNKTFLPSEKHENRNWFVIDCKNQKVGRLASLIVSILRGKQKTHYSPSVDIGDYVILINADSIIVNPSSKHYLVYNPGRPGSSLKIRNAIDSLPELTIQQAVKGMLTHREKNRLMTRLKIYADNQHPHEAQTPVELFISDSKIKNY